MAGRSQLPVQIMENQTRFDLNAAIENWRNELAAQPNLASDDRRELETHLRDAIAGFRQRGLNDEESFWLARRRVGQPPQLGEEFVKANPAKICHERIVGILWMALCGLPGIYFLRFLLWVRNFHPAVIFTLDFDLAVLFCLLALAGAVAGFPLFFGAKWARRFVGLVAVFTLIATVVGFVAGSLTSVLVPFSFLAIISIILLSLSPQNRKIPKHA
jgi:hypothetical protein